MNHAHAKKSPALLLQKSISLLLFSALVFFFFLLFARSNELQETAREALFFAAAKLIPALFPFAVLARFLLTSGLGKGGRLARLVTSLFHLPEALFPALFFGLFCGFPMGAFSAKALLDEKEITEEEAFRLTLFANNAGAPFLLFAAGSLFGGLFYGRILFFAQLTASVVVGLFLGHKAKKHRTSLGNTLTTQKKKPLLSLFADAVAGGGLAMLNITAFTLFFSVVAEALSLLPLPFFLSPFLVTLTEPVTALRTAATLPLSKPFSLAIAAFAMGFSGLSVLMPSEVLFQGKMPLAPWLKARFAIGSLSFLLTLLFAALFS